MPARFPVAMSILSTCNWWQTKERQNIRAVMVLLFHFRFSFSWFFTENRGFGFSQFRFLHEIRV